jgi:hypothetical protein
MSKRKVKTGGPPSLASRLPASIRLTCTYVRGGSVGINDVHACMSLWPTEKSIDPRATWTYADMHEPLAYVVRGCMHAACRLRRCAYTKMALKWRHQGEASTSHMMRIVAGLA